MMEHAKHHLQSFSFGQFWTISKTDEEKSRSSRRMEPKEAQVYTTDAI